MGLHKDTIVLINTSVGILEEQHPISLRALFYQLVSVGMLKNARSQYTKLSRAMTTARENGDVPWSWIVDNLRQTHKPSSWTGLADFGETVRDAYRKDFWSRQGVAIEVFVEKDAMAGSLVPVTSEYDVPLHVIRGFSSATFSHQIAQSWTSITKPIHCYYLGDFDPSGLEITWSLRDRLGEYSGRRPALSDSLGRDLQGVDDLIAALEALERASAHRGRGFHWERLIVLPGDFVEFDLMPLLAKKSDSRTKKFERQHGHHCAELDAVSANALRDRLRAAIKQHIDQDEWQRMQELEQHETAQIGELIGQLGA